MRSVQRIRWDSCWQVSPPVVMELLRFGCSVLCFTVFWLSVLLRLEATLLGQLENSIYSKICSLMLFIEAKEHSVPLLDVEWLCRPTQECLGRMQVDSTRNILQYMGVQLQLARATRLHRVGCGFESHYFHHYICEFSSAGRAPFLQIGGFSGSNPLTRTSQSAPTLNEARCFRSVTRKEAVFP